MRREDGRPGPGDDVEAVLDELYALPPSEFVARREERAARARTRRRAQDARRIHAARRPTLAGWAANLLRRSRPDEAQRFLELGRALREAYTTLDPSGLKELSAQRRRIGSEMSRQAAGPGREGGRPVADAGSGEAGARSGGGHGGGRVRATVPLPLVDAMRALLDGEDDVSLAVDGGRVTLEAGDRQTGGRCMEQDFPDYRRLVRLPAGRRAEVDVPAFTEAVRTGPVRLHEDGGTKSELTVLEVSEDGRVAPVPEGADGPDLVAVNRAFLLDALAAAADDRLVLEFGAPTTPLAIRGPGDEHTFSLLMPVRLSD
ncbi:DNA polymerase III subunit beta [Streptomyces sp. E1N211]|uniref:DNA polymerase III subunit beta n=1 Tax=Streptomyces sp. E1N211 TaxID=1851876 RepID=UPI000EF6E22E|nr:DNA polymerase III subunit beta [Streptomyces sp. E1N211]